MIIKSIVILCRISGLDVVGSPYARVKVYALGRAQFYSAKKHETWRGSPYNYGE